MAVLKRSKEDNEESIMLCAKNALVDIGCVITEKKNKGVNASIEKFENLSSYLKFKEGTQKKWNKFKEKRDLRLFGKDENINILEKVAENIVEDLFVDVLDWGINDLNWQLERADLVVSHNIKKYIVIETKKNPEHY